MLGLLILLKFSKGEIFHDILNGKSDGAKGNYKGIVRECSAFHSDIFRGILSSESSVPALLNSLLLCCFDIRHFLMME